MAVAAGVKTMPEYAAGFDSFGNNFAVPALFLHMFPGLVRGRRLCRHRHRRAGAGLDHGDRLRQSFHPQYLQGLHRARLHAAAPKRRIAKLVAFVAKLGALFFVLELQTTYAIQLQLLGGIWICQTVPAVLLALYVRLDPMRAAGGLGGGHGAGHLDGPGAGLQEFDLSAAYLWA